MACRIETAIILRLIRCILIQQTPKLHIKDVKIIHRNKEEFRTIREDKDPKIKEINW